jgi:DmsE family decaheme c-type cytochrome
MDNRRDRGVARALAGALRAAVAGVNAGNGRAVLVLLSSLVFLALLALARPAAAEPMNSGDGAYKALFAYAGQIAVGDTGAAAATSSTRSARADDGGIAALREYASQLGTSDRAGSDRSAAVKVAQADDFWSFMQGKGNNNPPPSGAAPAAPPKGAPKVPLKASPPVAATSVGSQVCLGCHAPMFPTFAATLMGALQKQGKMNCETCHGPGSEHVRLGGGRGVGGMISFRADDPAGTVEEYNGICLGCHKRGERTHWDGSTHETRKLACTTCHTIMSKVSVKFQLRTKFEPDTCFQCHKDRRAQMFRSSHMPLREGKMVCSDCHNPHGSVTEALLREDSVNDTCYKCHAEKRGPFLFEHTPVRENCDNCHEPHGSVNEALLKVSRPRLCFECHNFGHGANAGVGSQFTMGQSCTNCHVQIHGSNSPAGGAFQR